ncbi:thiol-activated cytolysin family protein [Sorangium sp. So ce542]|uniref:thiol-activated cytolysin family protein n=1 Tax=Sorangium sp. So ce542 TaxID=3133316 RepID=UPI003F60B7CD
MTTLREFILSMPHLSVGTEGIAAGTPSTTESGELRIVRTPCQATVNVHELAGFNPNIGVIWPGALVQGGSLRAGALAAINVARAPGTILLSTLGVPSSPAGSVTRLVSIEVQRPSAARVEEARSSLLARGAVVPAKSSQIFKQFFSLDHAMIQAGASASYLGGSMRGQLESDSYATQSNIMVMFTQEYYTVAMEPPTSPTSYFADTVTVEDLLPYANTLPGDSPAANPIVYIQSVTYGRLGLLLISSKESFTSLRRSVDAAVRFAAGSAHASYGSAEQRVVQESEAKLLLFGGSSAAGLRLIPSTQEALAAMQEWVTATLQPQDVQLGLPISYRVNYLRDNRLAILSFTTQYERIETSPLPKLVDWSISFHTADDDKDDDTVLNVWVMDDHGATLAHYAGSGKQNGDKEEFGNGSTKHLSLQPVRTVLARSDEDTKHIQLKIRIEPNGRDEWDFSYTLRARNTGDGPNFIKTGNMRLTHDDRERTH